MPSPAGADLPNLRFGLIVASDVESTPPLLKGLLMAWNEHDAALFFQTHYIMWVVGLARSHDGRRIGWNDSACGGENWRQIMKRECGFDEREVRALFLHLCQTRSDEAALESILRRFGLNRSLEKFPPASVHKDAVLEN